MKTKCWRFVFGLVVSVAILGVVVGSDKCKEVLLPDAVQAAIDAKYPQAVIEESKAEEEGLRVYEVELEQNDQEVELTISPDGKIMEKETEVTMNDLPTAVKAAIAKASKGGQVKEIEQETTYYIVTIKKLSEIEFASDGQLLSKEVEDEDDD